MIVFDLTNKVTFEKAKVWIDELNEKASLDILIALVGNKADMINERQIKREVKLKKKIIKRIVRNLQKPMVWFILNVLPNLEKMLKKCLLKL